MASSTKKKSKQEEPAELLSSQANSLVFISHDSRDDELAEAFSKLLSSLDFIRHGPFIEEMHDKESFIIVRELPDIIERYFFRAIEKSKRRSRNAVKKSTKRSASVK
jgi:hypothetical protein